MKVSTVFSAFAAVMYRKVNPWREVKRLRQAYTFEFWLNKHLTAMEQELDQKSRWLRNLDTARGGYSYQQLNLKERKAYLETRRENRRHLRRIRRLEEKIEIYESKLGYAANEVADLLEANEELRKIEKLLREVFDTLHGFTQPRSHIFPGGCEVDKAIVEYATRLENDLNSLRSNLQEFVRGRNVIYRYPLDQQVIQYAKRLEAELAFLKGQQK